MYKNKWENKMGLTMAFAEKIFVQLHKKCIRFFSILQPPSLRNDKNIQLHFVLCCDFP